MNILIAANDNYFIPTKVMLTSLLVTNTFEHHKIYFLYNSMKNKNVEKLRECVEKYDATFIAKQVELKDFEGLPVISRFPIEVYYKFMVHKMFCDEERVLWLDVDMIVKNSLKELYYQDFEEKSLIVCKDVVEKPEILLKKIDCPTNSTYFNVGMILFNMKKVQFYAIKEYFEWCEIHKDSITYPKQDILNGVYALDIKIVDYKIYNI